jgi:hypothetical protein
MNAYYEKIVDLWRAGNEEQAVHYFWECQREGQIGDAETEELNRFLPCAEVFIKRYQEASPDAQSKIKKLLGIT